MGVRGSGNGRECPVRTRDRYIDLLGALALIAVVSSDMFGWAGLT